MARHVDVPTTTEEVRRAYDEHAPLYALFEPVAEYLGLRRIRRRLLWQATGDVLEVAVGTGANLRYYRRVAVLRPLTSARPCWSAPASAPRSGG